MKCQTCNKSYKDQRGLAVHTSKMHKPPRGEVTKAQTASSMFDLRGFANPQAGTYATYRTMRNNSTISIGYAFSTGLIIAPKWNYVAQKGAPAGAADFIADMMKPLKPYLVEQSVSAIQNGWSPWEKVFDVVDGSLQLVKLKALSVDKTDILIDRNSGAYLGLRADMEHGIFADNRQGTLLPAEKTFIFSNDPSPYHGLYGRSRFESIREPWDQYQQMTGKLGMWLDQISSIIFMLEYPEQSSLDKDGNSIDAFDAAVKVMQDLRMGMGIAVPNSMHPYAEEYIRQGVTNPDLLKAWKLNVIETASNHGIEFKELQIHHESLILRGLLIPERSIIEGSSGTKAEADSHGSIAMMVSQQTLDQLIRQVNWHIINQALALKYGQSVINTVTAEAEPVDRSKRALQMEVLRMIFSPQNADVTLALLDIDQMLEQAGLPKASTGHMQNFAEIIATTKPKPDADTQDDKTEETGLTGEARPDDHKGEE